MKSVPGTEERASGEETTLIKRIAPLAAALALFLTAATPAHAGNYIGVSAVQFDQKVSVPGTSDHGYSTGGMVEIGSYLNSFLALEIRFADTHTAHFNQIGASQKASLNSYLLRVNLPISNSFWLYGMVGKTLGRASPSGSLSGYARKDSTSYGGGLQLQGTSWGVGAEWMRYWDNVNVGPGINITIDGIAGTLSYSF
jgi:hypothetical protein